MFETCEPSFVTNNTLLPEAICCLFQCNQLKTDVLLITIYCLGLFFVVYKNEIPYNRFFNFIMRVFYLCVLCKSYLCRIIKVRILL